jgi:hypothetical protein
MSGVDLARFFATLDQPDEPPAPPKKSEAVDLAAKLEGVTERAIMKSQEILDYPLEPGDENFAAVLRAQTAIVGSALITQTRVDETRLKMRRLDTLPRLIELVREEREKRAKEEAANAQKRIEGRNQQPDGSDSDGRPKV